MTQTDSGLGVARIEGQDSPEFREAYEAAGRKVAMVDDLMKAIDEQRHVLGMTKTELAEACDRNPSFVRRLFSIDAGNPTISTVADLADAVGLVLVAVPRAALPPTGVTGDPVVTIRGSFRAAIRSISAPGDSVDEDYGLAAESRPRYSDEDTPTPRS